MTRLSFSANLGFLWRELPFQGRVKRAAEAGFSAIEFHDQAQFENLGDLARLLDTTNLNVLALNTRMGETVGCAAIPGQIEQAREDIRAAAQIATEISARAIHVVSGKTNDEDAFATYLDNIEYALSQFHGQILIEPISNFAMPGYWMNHIDRALEVCAKIVNPRLKIMFDLFHMQHFTNNLIQAYTDNREQIGHIQIANLGDRSEPDESMRKQLLPAIVDAGYEGYFGCEYLPAGNTEDGLGYLTD